MRRALPLLLLVLLVLPLAGCNDRFWDEACDVVVINSSSCRLRILVDGWEAFTIRAEDTRTVDDVGRGRHTLEALDQDDRVVERRTIDLDRGEDFYWYIRSCH
ncbi:MAG TPA: hypothetical protein PLS53_18700 [Thermoanaerobaculaceae bacterium]|nr:hypothetical protein [Thermoanaerobaculaceae bacterium]HPS80191.1 hypothetical protein [Thermoanaerobaculaceae bacterium]